MAFGHKNYVFTHTITAASTSHQPVVFKLDLSDLILPFSRMSPIFIIDSMTLTAYKQGTCEKIPVKFAVLSENKSRVLTNDLQNLSSAWNVMVEPGIRVKIAGTDTEPFNRSLSVSEEQSRQATLNALTFMMSNSLCVANHAKGAFQVLSKSHRKEFQVRCRYCSRDGVISLLGGLEGPRAFSFPWCVHRYMCVPSHEPQSDRDYQALCRVGELLRSACSDELQVLTDFTRSMSQSYQLQDLDCSSFPPKEPYTGNIIIPYALMEQVTCLYQAMVEYVDTFGIVSADTPSVKVLIESPANNIGEITGSIHFTLMYGSSALSLFNALMEDESLASQQSEGINCSLNSTLLNTDVLIRRFPLNFRFIDTMELNNWYEYYYKTCALME